MKPPNERPCSNVCTMFTGQMLKLNCVLLAYQLNDSVQLRKCFCSKMFESAKKKINADVIKKQP